MNGAEWVAGPPWLAEDAQLKSRVCEVFQTIYDTAFAEELMVNHALPIEARALREIETWRVFLLLTPWMLARVYLHFDDPGIPIPAAWSAAEAGGRAHQVLGPGVSLTLLGQAQRTNLNYHPQLGHYLLQPLIMRMETYRSAQEVYAAWNAVIETRSENIKQRRLECHWQQDISRREFFTRLTRPST